MGCQLLLGGRCGSMLKTMVNRAGLVAAACAVIAPLGMLPSSPAFAEGGGVSGHSSSNTDGGVTISVSVSYNSANPGSSGSGRTTTSSRQVAASVKPKCYYARHSSGKDTAKFFKSRQFMTIRKQLPDIRVGRSMRRTLKDTGMLQNVFRMTCQILSSRNTGKNS